MTKSDIETLDALSRNFCSKVEEYGDNVLILVSAANHSDGSSDFISFGRGNLYAHIGMCKEFIVKQESLTRKYWEKRK